MRNRVLFIAAVFSLSSLAACTQKVGSGDTPPPATGAATNADDGPTATQQALGADSHATGAVIATFVTHDAKVSILSRRRSGELRVVVRRSDGVLVADGITIDELRATDPTLHAIVTSAVASNGGGTYVDATLDTHVH